MERTRGVDGRFVAERRVRERLVEVLSDPASDALSEVGLADRLGIKVEVLDGVLDEAVVREAMVRRSAEVKPEELVEVDRAMLMRAKEGNVGAARLIYMRMAARSAGVDEADMPSLEELEAELAVLRGKKV